MNIGIIIGRIGGVDGVALETEKWIAALNKLGHKVHVLTGKLQRKLENVSLCPELDFHHPVTVREQSGAFFKQNVKEGPFLQRLESETQHIESKILKWVVKNKIEMLVAQNALALPCHLSMGLAIKRILEDTGLPCVAHHHDFFWERSDRYKTKFSEVRKMIRQTYPPQIDGLKHVVINTHAKKELKKRFGIIAHAVPNVMDFSKPFAEKDTYNNGIKKDYGLGNDEVLLAQVTRIVRRKGIHTAIDLVHKLDDPRIKLLISGSALDDNNREYFCELKDQVSDLNIEASVFFGGDRFCTHRFRNDHRDKIYSLSDIYAQATACTYFSTYEGFGNAFVEATLAKKPIFVNNYKPVYWPDIGSKGFETVMIESGRLSKNSVESIRDILFKPKIAKEIAHHNYKLGKKYFSTKVLETHLQELFGRGR